MLQSLRLLQARLEAGRALRRTARQPRSLEKQGAGLGAKTGAGTRPLPFASWAGRRSAGTQLFPVRALLPRRALTLNTAFSPKSEAPKGRAIPAQGDALGGLVRAVQALKGRHILSRPYRAGGFPTRWPRALPWAGMGQAFGLQLRSSGSTVMAKDFIKVGARGCLTHRSNQPLVPS